MKKEITISCPEGYEIDKQNSTFEKIVFKKVVGEINSIQDAIEVLGESNSTVKQLRLLQSLEGVSDKLISEMEIEAVAKALNDGWKPNWKGANEYKYYIWWNMENNCFAVVDSFFRNANASSRLCFKSRALAEKASKILEKQFMNYYNF